MVLIYAFRGYLDVIIEYKQIRKKINNNKGKLNFIIKFKYKLIQIC